MRLVTLHLWREDTILARKKYTEFGNLIILIAKKSHLGMRVALRPDVRSLTAPARRPRLVPTYRQPRPRPYEVGAPSDALRLPFAVLAAPPRVLRTAPKITQGSDSNCSHQASPPAVLRRP